VADDQAHRLQVVAEEADHCTRCDLYRNATQTVFGEGPVPARLLLIGEQPGDQEDRQGHPFVGPAGKLLDRALEAAGIDRDEAYVTNAVKHFKWKARGTRRIHEKPSAREETACRPWFEEEVRLVDPAVIVALGATALRPLFEGKTTVSGLRGSVQTSRFDIPTVVTTHPSAILRMQEPDRTEALDAMVEDLRLTHTVQ
jgi:DNA polymerase